MAIPDAVALVISYLDARHSIPVVGTVPQQRPASFIQVRRIGGPALPPVRDLPRLDVLCWAADGPAAMALGNTVREQLFALARTMQSGVQIYKVEESIFRQFDDPETGQARSLGTYAITLRADEILPA